MEKLLLELISQWESEKFIELEKMRKMSEEGLKDLTMFHIGRSIALENCIRELGFLVPKYKSMNITREV